MTTNPKVHPPQLHALSPTVSRWCPLLARDIHALHAVGMYLDGRPLYHFSNHPIKWVRVTGVVVAIDEFKERRILCVDDSSGVGIECVCANPPAVATAGLEVGKEERHGVGRHLGEILKIQNAQGMAEGRMAAAQKTTEAQKMKTQPSVSNPQVPWQDLDVGITVKIKGLITQFRNIFQIEVIKLEIIRSTDAEVKCWDEVLTFREEVLGRLWVVSAEEEEACLRAVEEEKGRKQRMNSGKERGGIGVGKLKREETTEERRRRKEKEKEYHGKSSKCLRIYTRDEEERRRRHADKKQGRGREETMGGKDRVDYPSKAVRKRLAGKYDALGI